MKKMRLTALLLLTAVSADVHPFRAENKFVCTLCKESVEHVRQGMEGHLRNFVAKKIKGYGKWLDEDHIEDVQLVLASSPDAKAEDICEQWCNESDKHDVAQDWETHVKAVNSDPTSTWVAGENDLVHATRAELRTRLGAIVDPDWSTHHALAASTLDIPESWQAPESFDPRQQWPACAPVIGHIRDQSSCGSCWAFGSTEAFNDRHCIAGKSSGLSANTTTLLSPRDTAACCNFMHCFSQGCNGGQPGEAWNWFAKTGVVTGGDYSDIGKTDTCEPYPFAPCSHHVAPTKYPKCPEQEYHTPSCVHNCPNKGYPTEWGQDKRKAASAYSLGQVAQIQADMMKYGTVTAAFTVYADFPTYKSGVYVHKSGQALGGHAIRIVGWGVEGSTPYWLVANSWNETWGDNGYFKILRGHDECGIESQVSAGTA